MNWSDTLTIVLLGTIPALLCIAIAALVFRSDVARDRREAARDLRTRAFGAVIPLRIQAYERAMLYLTRLQPENLLLRQDPSGRPVAALKATLAEEIKTEYDHNAVQQLYVTEASWALVTAARDHMLQALADASTGLNEKDSGVVLAQALLRYLKEAEENPIERAKSALRADMARLLLGQI